LATLQSISVISLMLTHMLQCWLALFNALYFYSSSLCEEKSKSISLYVFHYSNQHSGNAFQLSLSGYAAFSIVFSSIHIFVSYFFVKLILKDLHPVNSVAKKFIRTALWFMVFSTFGYLAHTGFHCCLWQKLWCIQCSYSGLFALTVWRLVFTRNFGLGIHYVLKIRYKRFPF